MKKILTAALTAGFFQREQFSAHRYKDGRGVLTTDETGIVAVISRQLFFLIAYR